MGLTGSQLPVGVAAINGIEFLQCGHQPQHVFPIAGMHYFEIEGRHRRSVEDSAHAAHDDEVNAMPGQDFEDFQELGSRTLHGV